jgi:hypothetical protein
MGVIVDAKIANLRSQMIEESKEKEKDKDK